MVSKESQCFQVPSGFVREARVHGRSCSHVTKKFEKKKKVVKMLNKNMIYLCEVDHHQLLQNHPCSGMFQDQSEGEANFKLFS